MTLNTKDMLISRESHLIMWIIFSRKYVIGEASKSSVSPADVKVNYATHDDRNVYDNPI